MRVTSKGQVTIPRDLRATFGIEANTEVIFGIERGKITIVPKDKIARIADRDRLDRIIAILDRLEGAGEPAMHADDLLGLAKDR